MGGKNRWGRGGRVRMSHGFCCSEVMMGAATLESIILSQPTHMLEIL
jgi:hypothetical protein